MDNLPEDIFSEFFLRLPVKSLLRSKLVCKSWGSHISNPEFVKRYVQRTTNNSSNDLVILENYDLENYDLDVFDLEIYDTKINKFSVINVKCLDRAINLNLPPIEDNFDHVVASCNGLLCLAYDGYGYYGYQGRPQRLYLWNPVTTQVKDINNYTINFYVDAFGFCFDHATGDYKVVRIAQIEGTPYVHRVEVYSLNENCWKEIKVDLEIGKIESQDKVPTVNGSIYWLTRKKRHDQGLAVLSFNVQSMNFSTIQLPDSLSTVWPSRDRESCDYINILAFQVSGDNMIGILEFKESVALTNTLHGGKGIEIYTLEEGSCWTKKLTIKVKCLYYIVGCLKTGEFIGRKRKPCDNGTFEEIIVLYDSVNDVEKTIVPGSGSFRTFNFTESLVNLN